MKQSMEQIQWKWRKQIKKDKNQRWDEVNGVKEEAGSRELVKHIEKSDQLLEYQMTLVLAVLSWSRLDLIHIDTLSTHTDICCCICAAVPVGQVPSELQSP